MFNLTCYLYCRVDRVSASPLRFRLGLCLLMAGLLQSGYLFAASPSQAVAGDKRSPVTIEEATVRLESLLERFDFNNARQFRVSLNRETLTKGADSGEVRVASKGGYLLGNPYRFGGTVAFDLSETVTRVVYDRKEKEERVSWRQQRYLTARITLRPGLREDHQWSFDMVMLSHSIPQVIGQPYLKGAVTWLPDGVLLAGVGSDSAYAPDGKLIPSALYGKIQLTRQGEKLIIDDQWSNYHPAVSPDGATLPVPDFGRPIGAPAQWLSGKGARVE